MTNSINAIGGARPLLTAPALNGANSTNAAVPGQLSFSDVLLQSLEQVNQMDKQAQSAIATGLADNDLTQAEIFTAVKKADLAFRTMLQIRNKLMDAYNEVKQLRM